MIYCLPVQYDNQLPMIGSHNTCQESGYSFSLALQNCMASHASHCTTLGVRRLFRLSSQCNGAQMEHKVQSSFFIVIQFLFFVVENNPRSYCIPLCCLYFGPTYILHVIALILQEPHSWRLEPPCPRLE